MSNPSTVGASRPQGADAFIAMSLRRPTHNVVNDWTLRWTEPVGSNSCEMEVSYGWFLGRVYSTSSPIDLKENTNEGEKSRPLVS